MIYTFCIGNINTVIFLYSLNGLLRLRGYFSILSIHVAYIIWSVFNIIYTFCIHYMVILYMICTFCLDYIVIFRYNLYGLHRLHSRFSIKFIRFAYITWSFIYIIYTFCIDYILVFLLNLYVFHILHDHLSI